MYIGVAGVEGVMYIGVDGGEGVMYVCVGGVDGVMYVGERGSGMCCVGVVTTAGWERRGC